MYVNKNCKTVKYNADYEEVREFLFEAIYKDVEGVYVIDDEGHYVGYIGRTELIKYEAENRLIINENSKTVVCSEKSEEVAKSICRANPKIRKVPVLDESGRLLYELHYEYSDKNEMVVEELRNKGLIIGRDVTILNCGIDTTWGWLISVGNHVTLTHTTILAHDASTKMPLGKTKLGKVSIGDNVFVGYSTILPNTKLGNKVIVGAGTVVSKDIPDNSVVVGNPMRIIGSYDDYLAKHEEKMKNGIVYDIDPNSLTWADKKRMREEIDGIVYIN